MTSTIMQQAKSINVTELKILKQTVWQPPKLPKQWKHWCNRLNLRAHGRIDRGQALYYLKGHGHVWRITSDYTFQRGDTYEEFDRWALCDIVEIDIPKTFKELEDFVKSSVQKS